MRLRVMGWILLVVFSTQGRWMLWASESVHTGDVACGPRCVKYILDRFQQKSDLVALTQKLQWPDMDRGSNLMTLAKELESAGLYTKTVATSGSAVIHWPYPAIVYFRNAHGDNLLGHFAVLLPESTDKEAVCWNGLVGIERVPWSV